MTAREPGGNLVSVELTDTFPPEHPLLPTSPAMQTALVRALRNEHPGFNCFLFVYDASSRESFEQMWEALETVTKFAAGRRATGPDSDQGPRVLKVIVGSKADLKAEKSVLQPLDKQRYRELGIERFLVSTLTNYKVEKLWAFILRHVKV